jgi:hypothetical protein
MSDVRTTAPGPEEGPDGRPALCLEDFRAVDWRGVTSSAPFRGLRELADRFRDRAQQALSADDRRGSAVYQSLADVCSLVLREDRHDDPFMPFMVTQAFRTVGIGDMSPESVAAFAALAPEVAEPSVRARLADVAWVRRRDYRAAKLAVASYLKLAETIEPEAWPAKFRLLERAVAIALQLGRGNEELRHVVAFLEDLIDRCAPTEDGFFCARLMQLLLAVGCPDGAKYAPIAEALARRALTAKAFHRSREYWMLAADWAGRARASGQKGSYLQQVGESYVAEADEALERPLIGPLLAAGHLQRAIEAFRAAGGARARVDELRAKLVDIQPAAVASIPTISHKVDITEHVLQAEQAVAGKSFDEALVAFAGCAPIPEVSKLRETALRHEQRYPLTALMPKVFHSTSGKVIARQGSLMSNDPTEQEAAIRLEMLALAAQYHEMLPQMTIDPARRQMVREHPIRSGDLVSLIRYGPIAPYEREAIIADGIVAGFYGDMVQAVHLLVPQLEHSVRVLLHRAGIQVSALDSFGIQRELNLNNLLYVSKLKELLGEDLVFTLQGLLVEPPGANIRNGMAHGLMSQGEFFSGSSMYLWWLSVRLFLLPGLLPPEVERPTAGESDSN